MLNNSSTTQKFNIKGIKLLPFKATKPFNFSKKALKKKNFL